MGTPFSGWKMANSLALISTFHKITSSTHYNCTLSKGKTTSPHAVNPPTTLTFPKTMEIEEVPLRVEFWGEPTPGFSSCTQGKHEVEIDHQPPQLKCVMLSLLQCKGPPSTTSKHYHYVCNHAVRYRTTNTTHLKSTQSH